MAELVKSGPYSDEDEYIVTFKLKNRQRTHQLERLIGVTMEEGMTTLDLQKKMTTFFAIVCAVKRRFLEKGVKLREERDILGSRIKGLRPFPVSATPTYTDLQRDGWRR